MAQMLGRVTLNLEIEGSIKASSRIFLLLPCLFSLDPFGTIFCGFLACVCNMQFRLSVKP